MFSLRNKNDIGIFQMKKAPYLLLWTIHGHFFLYNLHILVGYNTAV